jgi:alginate O-acetyltransferase complex protein AlgI
MLFNSQLFVLGFLPPLLAVFYLVAGWRTARQLVVIGGSVLFYGLWNWRFVPLLAGLTLANWLIVQLYGRTAIRGLLLGGVALNLTALGVFKYANFFAGTASALLGTPPVAWSVVLPLGISFFTFQKISYLVDLYRGARPIYGLLDFAEFVSFFPQLIAGPLVRHDEIIPQFARDPRGPDAWENLSRGMALFVIGMAKKACLADTLALAVDPLFAKAALGPLNATEAWSAALCYALQIYFDFSGYSDMAIGLGLMFGLRLPFNFDAPYRAVSIRDFWRRWHMTLSRFLRDYLYIPLGGNRVAPPRQAANVILTMLLGGLWHGAAWSFVAWGGLHGVALALNSAWDRSRLRMPRLLGWLLTMLFVTASWVLFRAESFATAWSVLRSMAGFGPRGAYHLDNALNVYAAALIAVIGPTSQSAALRQLRPSAWLAVPLGLAAVFTLLLIGGRVPNAFIYFRF